MKIDSVIWNNLVEMSEKDYNNRFDYLFDKTEYLSDKLKKYKLNNAQQDLKNGLTSYHFFIAKARESFNNSITVHKINKDIIDKILNTKIDKMPDEIPAMFKRPFIIEAHDLNSNLFGDINSIVGFFHELDKISSEKLNSKYLLTVLLHTRPINDENWYQTSIKLNNLARRAKVDFSYLGSNLFCLIPPIKNNTWHFDKTDYTREILMDINYCNQCSHKIGCEGAAKPDLYCNYLFCYDGLCDNLLSFITIFNYMLEAENSPIKINKKVEHTTSVIAKKK
jgi:hypothetical protein